MLKKWESVSPTMSPQQEVFGAEDSFIWKAIILRKSFIIWSENVPAHYS